MTSQSIQIQNLFKNILMLLFITSCSMHVTSENFVQKADAEFTGGVYKNQEWKSSMYFKRFTWMKHMNMNFDFLVHRFDRESKFKLWFAEDEVRELNQCPQFFIFIVYSNPSANLSYRRFEQQLFKQNFIRVQVNEFKQYLINHPAYFQYNLTKYNVYGFCQKNFSQNIQYTFNFPGYKEVTSKF